MFFFKKKPKVIFWSTVDGVEKTTPILPSKKVIPSWFKTLKSFPKNYNKDFSGTVKACPSFVEYMANGYVLTAWCDMRFNIKDKGIYTWKTPSQIYRFDDHPAEQYAAHLPEHEKNKIYAVAKAVSPWRCKTDPGYVMMQQSLYYEFNDVFDVPPGIIWTNFYHEINPQLIFRQKGEFFIPRGTPLSILYLIKKEEVDFIITNKDDKIVKNLSEFLPTKFKNAYREIRDKIIRKNNERS